MGLLAAQGVFDAAHGILNLAFSLISFAFGIQLGVADNLANSLFHLAFDDLCRTRDAIFVHGVSLCDKAPGEVTARARCVCRGNAGVRDWVPMGGAVVR